MKAFKNMFPISIAVASSYTSTDSVFSSFYYNSRIESLNNLVYCTINTVYWLIKLSRTLENIASIIYYLISYCLNSILYFYKYKHSA